VETKLKKIEKKEAINIAQILAEIRQQKLGETILFLLKNVLFAVRHSLTKEKMI
jgi:hypothetical protein